MEVRKYTQFGTISVIVLLLLLPVFTAKLIYLGVSSGPETIFYASGILVLLISLLILYKITITINETNISFKLGIGLIGKTYKIKDIKSCKPVTNSFFSGIGIRLIRHGWLFSVSGFKAIELSFNDKDSVIRIGTDKPEEICEVIQGLTGKNLTETSNFIAETKILTPYRLILLIFAGLLAAMIIYNGGESRVKVDNNCLIIKGFYGMTIPFSEIKGIDTLSKLPLIEMKLSGYTFPGSKIGNYRLADQSKIKLFVKTGHPPFLRIWIKDGVPVYVNFKDKQKTIDVYREILKFLEK